MMDQHEAGKTITVLSPRAFRASRMLIAPPHPAQARWPWPKFSLEGMSIFFIEASSLEIQMFKIPNSLFTKFVFQKFVLVSDFEFRAPNLSF
jgi:hypothetical protein